MTARRADAGQTSASARSGRRNGGMGRKRAPGSEKDRRTEREVARACVCVCDTEREKKVNDRGQGRGAVAAGLKKAVEKEYIAVIIAIDFYRQTITPGAPDGYPRRSGDAFFSFSLPAASLPFPLFSRPRPPPFRQRLFPMHLASQRVLRFSCAPLFVFPFFFYLLRSSDIHLFHFKCTKMQLK